MIGSCMPPGKICSKQDASRYDPRAWAVELLPPFLAKTRTWSWLRPFPLLRWAGLRACLCLPTTYKTKYC
ncbi:hypothetical protein NC651_015099 [Populus alba x Populus x berolinensis]|nr:hypothetical protein NC651_015099 [Populus alba x Populus x berolinensis]